MPWLSALGFSKLTVHPHAFVSCKRYSGFRQTLLIINQVLVGGKASKIVPHPVPVPIVSYIHRFFLSVLLTLRIYALYECSLKLLISLISLGAVLASIACVSCTSHNPFVEYPRRLPSFHSGHCLGKRVSRRSRVEAAIWGFQKRRESDTLLSVSGLILSIGDCVEPSVCIHSISLFLGMLLTPPCFHILLCNP